MNTTSKIPGTRNVMKSIMQNVTGKIAAIIRLLEELHEFKNKEELVLDKRIEEFDIGSEHLNPTGIRRVTSNGNNEIAILANRDMELVMNAGNEMETLTRYNIEMKEIRKKIKRKRKLKQQDPARCIIQTTTREWTRDLKQHFIERIYNIARNWGTTIPEDIQDIKEKQQ